MNVKRPLMETGVVLAAMLALSAWANGRLPPGPVAVHWGLDGAANGFQPKAMALLTSPLIVVGIAALLALLPQVMPKNGSLDRSRPAYFTVWRATVLVVAGTHALIIAKALRIDIDVPHCACLLVAAVLAMIGNVLGKVRYNYVLGIRTPWTLSSERVWDRTHRFAGWAMVIGALVLGVASLILPTGPEGDRLLVAALTACAAGPALTSAVYSYLLARRTDLAA